MLSITPQERRIIIFLVATLLIGCAVRLVRHHLFDGSPDVSIISSDRHDEEPAGAPTPDSQSVRTPERIDINTADPKQLQSLSGIGPQLARRIVEHRDLHGPFSNPGDITAVPGIGEKTYLRLRERITVVSDESPEKDKKTESGLTGG